MNQRPGPRSRALLDDLARYECPAITARRARRADESGLDQDPIVWASGCGATITDVDGHQYLDLTAAFAVSTYGHAHPRLVDALSHQAARLMHGMGDAYPTDIKIQYAKALGHFVPDPLEQSIFGQSGSEAVEAALKTAWIATGRSRILAFQGAYHGLALGALSTTAYKSSFRSPFRSALNLEVSHAPYPYCYRCPFGLERSSCDLACLSYTQHLLDHPATGVHDVAAVILEPIQGRGGIVAPPEAWLEGLNKLCHTRGILLILDEIFTGFARTGRRFAMEDGPLEPDLICLGKALTGGFPLSAAVGTPAVMEAWGNSMGEALHTSTFLGNPMACAVGLEALAIFEEEEILDRAQARGQEIHEHLKRLAHAFPEVMGEQRGRGLMQGIELIKDQSTRAPNTPLSLALMRAALERGLLILPSGPYGQMLTITPPAVIGSDELDHAFGILEECLRALL